MIGGIMYELAKFNSLFDDVLRSDWGRGFTPALDIAERDDEYLIRLDVPGVKEEDLNVEVRDNIMTIRGHREYSYDDSTGGLNRMERSYGTFQRSVALPRGAGEVYAELDAGVLTLHVEKPVEAQPRKIEIDSRKAIEA
jgi:HSP20 family protein